MNDGFLIHRTSVENGIPCLTNYGYCEANAQSNRKHDFQNGKM